MCGGCGYRVWKRYSVFSSIHRSPCWLFKAVRAGLFSTSAAEKDTSRPPKSDRFIRLHSQLLNYGWAANLNRKKNKTKRGKDAKESWRILIFRKIFKNLINSINQLIDYSLGHPSFNSFNLISSHLTDLFNNYIN